MNSQRQLTVEQISKLLADLARSGFWGMVQIDFQNGEPIVVRETRTLKSLDKGWNNHDNSAYSR